MGCAVLEANRREGKSNTECKSAPRYAGEVQDVLIVGGGIIGTSLAAHLVVAPGKLGNPQLNCGSFGHEFSKPTPLRVTLLEKQSIASEATGLSAGTIHSAGPLKSELPLDNSLARTFTFAHISNKLYEHLESSLEVGYTKCGSIHLACNQEEKKWAARKAEIYTSHAEDSSGVRFLESKEKVGQIVPVAQDVVGGTFIRDSAQVNAGLATHALADMASEAGANIVENASVTSLERDASDIYNVTTSSGDVYRARNVVVASGAWINDVLPKALHQPVRPVKGLITMSNDQVPSTSLEALPVVYFVESEIKKASLKTSPMCITVDADNNPLYDHAYGKRGADGRFYFGASRMHPAHDRDYAVDESNLRRVMNSKVFAAIPALRPHFEGDGTGSWAGLMPFSEDNKPIIDVVDGKGLYVASGFGAFGICWGPGTTLFLAQWLRGGVRPRILDGFGATRFKSKKS